MPANLLKPPPVREKEEMSADDQEWIRRVREGDSSAYDQLMEKYMNRAYLAAFRIVNDASEAEDMTQEAFLKAYRSLKGFRGDSAFYTWLCRILVNLCRDHLRKKRFRTRFLSFLRDEDESADPIEKSVPDPHWSVNPDKMLEQTEWDSRLQALLSRLPTRQRTIFVFKHLQDLRIREIAKILGLSEGTVKVHLFRAVRNLREWLQQAEEDQP